MLRSRPIRIFSAFVGFTAAGLFVLSRLLASTVLSWPAKLGWMLGFALLFLLAGVWAASRIRIKPAGAILLPGWEIGFVLSAAYLAPLLIFRLPAFIDSSNTIFPGSGLADLAHFNTLNGFPGSHLWPVGVLVVYLIGLHYKKGKWPLTTRGALYGVPFGFALWLVCNYLFSVLSRTIPINTPVLSPWTYSLTALTVLLLSPWVIEIFFRVELWHILTEKAGPTGATFLVALVYATLQFRLLLWLPAFLFSLGLSELYRRTGSLLAIAAAHTVFNALMLLLNIGLVL